MARWLATRQGATGVRRKLITMGRILNSGGKNFARNSWLSIAAIAVMVVSIIIILSSLILNVATHNIIAELSKNIKVSVYFVPDTEPDPINELKNDFSNNENVDSVKYISAEEAQKAFIESNKNDKQLLQGLALIGGNSLPASLEVSVKDLSKINQVGDIAKQAKYEEIVEEVSLGKTEVQKTIDRAADAQKFITRASVVAAAIFAIVSMLIIFNTIRMAIFTRQEEIRTEKLLGATPGYIRGPFLVESSIYGVSAGLIATTVVLTAAYAVSSKVANQPEFTTTKDFFSQPMVVVALYGGSVLFGILVGILSSAMAMSKYLKLKRW